MKQPKRLDWNRPCRVEILLTRWAGHCRRLYFQSMYECQDVLKAHGWEGDQWCPAGARRKRGISHDGARSIYTLLRAGQITMREFRQKRGNRDAHAKA